MEPQTDSNRGIGKTQRMLERVASSDAPVIFVVCHFHANQLQIMRRAHEMIPCVAWPSEHKLVRIDGRAVFFVTKLPEEWWTRGMGPFEVFTDEAQGY